MAEATSQPGAGGEGQPGAGGNNGGAAATPPATTATGQSNTGAATPPAPSSNDNFDPKILEDPKLWEQPRMKELLEAQKSLKKMEDAQKKTKEEELAKNNEFKTLAEQRAEEITKLQGQIQTMTLDAALATKLAAEKVVDVDAALKLADKSKLSVGEDGQVKGIDEVVTALKTDRAYLFNNQGASAPSVGAPSNTGNGTPQGGQSTGYKFTRAQIANPQFYQAHRTEILEAQQQGLIDPNN